MKYTRKGVSASLALSILLSGCGGSGDFTTPPNNPPVETHRFVQTNLVSDQPGATIQDADMVNPWGIAMSGGSPFWVANNRTGKATLYNTAGAKQGLVVNIAGAGGTANAPVTGQVFNASPAFVIPGSTPARFIFSTLDGVISAWNGGATSVMVADRSANGAVYTGLATGSSGGNDFLYAPNFAGGTIDVFGANFAFVKSFTDPNIPVGFSPFGIKNIDGKLFVTFARPSPTGAAVGVGAGFVDVFDTDGTLISRLVTRGLLNAPWGLTKAPAGFGGFNNALLVGNFGDGRINAYDIDTGASLGAVADADGNIIRLDGLWDLTFGNGQAGGLTTNLYFTAGIGGENHGLFGFLVPAP